MAIDKKDAVAILTFYRNIDGEICFYRGMVNELESYYDTIGGQSLDGMPKGKNHITNAVEAVALNLPDGLEQEIDHYTTRIGELQALKVEILKEISRLEYRLKSIVTDYYLHGLKWEQVSARNHYSERQCKNIRDAAVGSLVKPFGANKIIAGFSFSKVKIARHCPLLSAIL